MEVVVLNFWIHIDSSGHKQSYQQDTNIGNFGDAGLKTAVAVSTTIGIPDPTLFSSNSVLKKLMNEKSSQASPANQTHKKIEPP